MAEINTTKLGLFPSLFRHTLAALKAPDLKLENFPMAKYIIQTSVDESPPGYTKSIKEQVDFKVIMPMDPDKKYADDYGLADLLDTSSWPTAAQLGMDESQYAAFRAARTREISIIQGPPGTGKTFIGIQIAKFLLANRRHFLPYTKAPAAENDDAEDDEDGPSPPTIVGSPVLVVCYTNHALDQFLEAVLKEMEEMGMRPEDQLIRVGGRTKSERMSELVLHKVSPIQ
jgi:hypothetical protein